MTIMIAMAPSQGTPGHKKSHLKLSDDQLREEVQKCLFDED